jgi:hypothetical protein
MEDFPVPLLSGGVRPVQRYFTRFSPWFGPEVERTWNKSPLVEYTGRTNSPRLGILLFMVLFLSKYRKNNATYTREYPQSAKPSVRGSM